MNEDGRSSFQLGIRYEKKLDKIDFSGWECIKF